MGAGNKGDNNSTGRNGMIWKVLTIVCLVGAVAAIGFLIRDAAERRREEELLAQLAAQTEAEQTDSDQTEPEDLPDASLETPTPEKSWEELSLEEKNSKLEETFGINIPEKDIDFSALQQEVNADIYAWLYIPDSTIDFPVLQHPEDNSYYLNYNIDGSEGRPGCIYTENYNSKDFTDHNTVLYGHNMRNGTMFAGIHQFEDADYFAKNQYIYVYTPDEVFVYRIFAAYEFSNVHLLAGYETKTEEGFGEYLEEVMAVRSMNSNFDRDVEVTEQDRIITLSTCVTNKSNERYLVQGVLLRVEEGTDPADGAED